jgi:hypothetical protein
VRKDQVQVYVADAAGAIWELLMSIDDVVTVTGAVIPAGNVAFGSTPRAVSRGREFMDLFWVDPGGRILSAFWTDAAGTWSAPFEIAPKLPDAEAHLAAPATSVTAVDSRGGLQVFWEEPDQSVWSTWWAARPDGGVEEWSRPVSVLAEGTVQAGAGMAAVARDVGHVRLFFLDRNGTPSETWWGTTP